MDFLVLSSSYHMISQSFIYAIILNSYPALLKYQTDGWTKKKSNLYPAPPGKKAQKIVQTDISCCVCSCKTLTVQSRAKMQQQFLYIYMFLVLDVWCYYVLCLFFRCHDMCWEHWLEWRLYGLRIWIHPAFVLGDGLCPSPLEGPVLVKRLSSYLKAQAW